jgi:uncharacterized protein YacL
MFLWFRKLFRMQTKLNLALFASPFVHLRKSPFVTLLRQTSKPTHTAYNFVSYIIFLYIGVIVWNQLTFNFTSIEQSMLSLNFTVIIVGFGMFKLMLLLRSDEILQLLNSLILFEMKNFGNQPLKHYCLSLS